MQASIVGVLSAFVGTESASRDASETDRDDPGGVIAQVGEAQHAGSETLATESNAFGQVGFVNAGVEATLAMLGAGCAGFDANLELCTIHGEPVQQKDEDHWRDQAKNPGFMANLMPD
jgi:hypothetical protein